MEVGVCAGMHDDDGGGEDRVVLALEHTYLLEENRHHVGGTPRKEAEASGRRCRSHSRTGQGSSGRLCERSVRVDDSGL